MGEGVNIRIATELQDANHRIKELETQNKILSDSIMAGTNVYKRQLKNAETESRNRGRALKEIIRLASEYTPSINQAPAHPAPHKS